jgi:hypothetical protein
MTNSFSQFFLAPFLAWLTVVALGVVAYLGRLEYLERRKNRRLDAKRAELEQNPPVHGAQRPLAMKQKPAMSFDADCPIPVRTFQKSDTFDRLRPAARIELN